MKMLLAVAAGGAIGALARYGVHVIGGRLWGHGFPWSTLVVNVLGGFLLGALVVILALKWSPSQEMRAFLTVGLLGAFTTFSTFSLDAVTLAQRQAWTSAAIYIGASVVLSIGAFVVGLRLTRLAIAG